MHEIHVMKLLLLKCTIIIKIRSTRLSGLGWRLVLGLLLKAHADYSLCFDSYK